MSSNARRRKSQAQKERKDASVLAKQYHQVVVTVLDHLEWPPERRAEIAQLIGAVLPLALAHHDGGARKARKAAGPLEFIRETCEDALGEGPFYDTEGHAIDLPTELHRTPPPSSVAGRWAWSCEALRGPCT